MLSSEQIESEWAASYKLQGETKMQRDHLHSGSHCLRDDEETERNIPPKNHPTSHCVRDIDIHPSIKSYRDKEMWIYISCCRISKSNTYWSSLLSGLLLSGFWISVQPSLTTGTIGRCSLFMQNLYLSKKLLYAILIKSLAWRKMKQNVSNHYLLFVTCIVFHVRFLKFLLSMSPFYVIL